MVRVAVNENAAIWNTDVKDVDFSTRAMNALCRNDLFTLRDVMDHWNELTYMRHIGDGTLKEIRSKTMKAYTDSLTNEEYGKWLERITELN